VLSHFFGEESFFGVSCVEPSDSVAGNRVHGLEVTSFFYGLLIVHLSIILAIDQLNTQILVL